MVNHLGYARDEAVTEATKLYISHGTTLAGLVERGTPVDFELWHREVHWGHVPYKELLHPDPGLHKILTAMDLPKYVFTNADKYVTGWLKCVTVYMCDFVWEFRSLAKIIICLIPQHVQGARADMLGSARHPRLLSGAWLGGGAICLCGQDGEGRGGAVTRGRAAPLRIQDCTFQGMGVVCLCSLFRK